MKILQAEILKYSDTTDAIVRSEYDVRVILDMTFEEYKNLESGRSLDNSLFKDQS